MTAHAERLLRAAAEESLERIRLDHARAPERLKPCLAFIRDNLFDSELDVTYLKRRVGIRDNSMVILFHSAVGQPPFRYIQDRRFETACRLLADADLDVWKIAELLGFSSLQVFSRAFKRWSGERPAAFRRRRHRENPASGTTFCARRLARSAGLSVPALLRLALQGELEPEHAGSLIDRLHALYPANAPASNRTRAAPARAAGPAPKSQARSESR